MDPGKKSTTPYGNPIKTYDGNYDSEFLIFENKQNFLKNKFR